MQPQNLLGISSQPSKLDMDGKHYVSVGCLKERVKQAGPTFHCFPERGLFSISLGASPKTIRSLKSPLDSLVCKVTSDLIFKG